MRSPSRPTFGHLAKVHTFRFLTMIGAWMLIFCAFLYHPEWIRGTLRLLTHAIETVADQVPEPWGSRAEVILRELGGIIWVQITVAIVLLRLILWVPFHICGCVGRGRRTSLKKMSRSLALEPRGAGEAGLELAWRNLMVIAEINKTRAKAGAG